MTLGKMLGLLAGNLGVRLGGAALGLAAQLVIARNFSQSDVGVIFLTMSLTAFFSLAGTYGYAMLALTQLPRFYALHLPKLTAAFHASFWHDSVEACLLVILSALLFWLVVPVLPQTELAMACAALCVFPAAFLRYYSAIANSLRYFQWAYVPDFIIRPTILLIYVVCATWLGFGLNLGAILAVYVIGHFIVTSISAFAVRGHGLKFSFWKAYNPTLANVLRQRAFALGVVGLVTLMFADVVTMMGAIFLDHDDLAVLGLTVRLAAIAGFVIQSAQQFILPDLTEAITNQKFETAEALLKRLSLITLGTMALGIIFTLALGDTLLQLFGPDYMRGHWLLLFFIFAQAIRALSGMNQSLLSIAGLQWQSAGACFIGIIVFIMAWSALAMPYGLLAPGIALIAAELTWAAVLAFRVRDSLGRRGDFIWLYLGR